MTGQLNNTTPSFFGTITKCIDTRLTSLHTAMPGVVDSYDRLKKTASIKPALQRQMPDGTSASLPVIPNVPVMFPQTANALISWPLTKGDTGLIVFSERSIDRWKTLGGVVNPKDLRKHDFSDALFYPGLMAAGQGKTPDPDALLIQMGSLSLKLFTGGKISVSNGSIDLIDKLVELGRQIQAITVVTALGVQPIVNQAAIQTLVDSIEEFKV